MRERTEENSFRTSNIKKIGILEGYATEQNKQLFNKIFFLSEARLNAVFMQYSCSIEDTYKNSEF